MKYKFAFLIFAFFSIVIIGCSTDDNSQSSDPKVSTPPDPFIVTPAVIPVASFTGFSPQNAFLGDVVTVYGANLDKNLANLRISFGGVETEIISATSTYATVIVPNDLNEAAVKIKLTSGKTTFISAEDFHLNGPVINSISYAKGFAGQQVIIKGKGFRNSFHIGQIAFNDIVIDASLTNVGNSELFMTVPKGFDAGKYPISVIIAGMKDTVPSLFEVVVPSITSITPNTVSQNSKITINGKNLKDIYGIGIPTLVSFTDAQTGTGSTAGTVITSEENKIEVTVPRLQEGHTYRVKVLIIRSSVEASDIFTYKE